MGAMKAKAGWIVAAALGLFVVASISGVVSGGSLDPPGIPDSTMKPLNQIDPGTPITALPMTITQSGSYYFTKPLGLSGVGTTAINVLANDVTIDLRGFTLSKAGPSAATRPDSGVRLVAWHGGATNSHEPIPPSRPPELLGNIAVGIDAQSVSNVTVRNGSVIGMDGGIRGGSNARVEDVSIVIDPASTFSALETGPGSHVTGLRVRYTGAALAVYVGAGSRLEDCVVIGAPAVGGGISTAAGASIDECTVEGYDVGIDANAGTAITDCVVTGSGSTAVFVGLGGTVEGCLVDRSGAGARGIQAQTDSVVRNNRVEVNGTGTTVCVNIRGLGTTVIDSNQLFNCTQGISNDEGGAGNRIIRNSYIGAGLTLDLTGLNDVGVLSLAGGTNNPWANMGP